MGCCCSKSENPSLSSNKWCCCQQSENPSLSSSHLLSKNIKKIDRKLKLDFIENPLSRFYSKFLD